MKQREEKLLDYARFLNENKEKLVDDKDGFISNFYEIIANNEEARKEYLEYIDELNSRYSQKVKEKSTLCKMLNEKPTKSDVLKFF